MNQTSGLSPRQFSTPLRTNRILAPDPHHHVQPELLKLPRETILLAWLNKVTYPLS